MIHVRNLSIAVMCLAIAWFAYRASLAADAVTIAATEAPQAVLSIVQPALGIVDLRTQEALGIVRETTQRADALLIATEKDANRTIADLAIVANKQTSDALAIVKDAAANAVTEVQGLRADLKPTLENTAVLTKNANDSWNDLYFDVKAAVESTTVTLTSVAMASESIRTTAPQLTASAVGIGKSADGISADVHTMTSDFVRPKTFWGNVKSWLELSGKLASRLL